MKKSPWGRLGGCSPRRLRSRRASAFWIPAIRALTRPPIMRYSVGTALSRASGFGAAAKGGLARPDRPWGWAPRRARHREAVIEASNIGTAG
jgi:hypothetical protein